MIEGRLKDIINWSISLVAWRILGIGLIKLRKN